MSRAPLPRLHAVATDEVLTRADLEERAAAIAAHGSVAIHIRAPGLEGAVVATLARRVRDAAPAAQILINDRADVAKAVNADGVHLPEAGIPTPAARTMLGDDAWIGRSVHAPAAVAPALVAGADYVFLGPIWPTTSHPGTGGLGPDALASAEGRPVLAIGGVTPDLVTEARRAGAYGVAAVRALWLADDPGSVAREMLLSLEFADEES